jgi:AcrR family transcriptional regulator
MGVKERKERQKLEMKDLILRAAHDLFLDKGSREVSIRNIADAIEYSPATIYLYFKDKNEIFMALQEESFRFFNTYTADLAKIKDPFKRLVALGERYMEFALKNPGRYELMFITESPMHCEKNKEDWAEGARTLEGVELLLGACKKQGYFKGQDVKALGLMIWSHMHGLCALALRERLKAYTEEERGTIRMKAFKVFIAMMKQL